jgi:hypothetical protein
MSNANCIPSDHTKSRIIQQKLRRYLALFDGKGREFDEVVNKLFDSLYHDDFTYTKDDEGEVMNRNEFKQLHAAILAKDNKIDLVSFHQLHSNTYDVKFSRLVTSSQDGYNIIRQIITVRDHKIIHTKNVKDASSLPSHIDIDELVLPQPPTKIYVDEYIVSAHDTIVKPFICITHDVIVKNCKRVDPNTVKQAATDVIQSNMQYFSSSSCTV